MSTLTLLLFLFPLAYSPGPGNLFFAALGAGAGWRAVLPAFWGYHVATLLAALATGAGLMVLAGPEMMRTLGLAGSAYMLWLALKLWRAGAANPSAPPARASMLDGVALLALNPKAWAIMAALFAHYPNANAFKIAEVAAVFTLNNALAFALWTLAGYALLAKPSYARLANRVFALILAAVALHLALG
jgi:threonine/homoserine/homoserine lactone efflux protein